MYKIIFNSPKGEKEINVKDEMIEEVMSQINSNKIIQLGENYHKTSYFVEAIKSNKKELSNGVKKKLEETKNKYLNK